MALNVESVTFDTTDPEKAAQWWAEAAGGQVTPYVPGEFVAVERQPGKTHPQLPSVGRIG